MPELNGHYHTGQTLLLVKLQRQTVRVVKKGKTLVGEGIDTDRFTRYAVRLQMFYCVIQVINAEGKMAQSTGFRARRARRRK